jgi:hypothetical protein
MNLAACQKARPFKMNSTLDGAMTGGYQSLGGARGAEKNKGAAKLPSPLPDFTLYLSALSN